MPTKSIEITCPNCGYHRLMRLSAFNKTKTGLCIRCTNKMLNPGKNKLRRKYPQGFGNKRTNPPEYYVRVRVKGHPRASKAGQVKRPVLVMESNIGRYLLPNEEVHHINGNIKDDRIGNLQLFSHGDHTKEHARLRRLAKENMSLRQCEPV